MEDYPSNSNKSKRKREEKPDPIVFHSEDGAKNPKAEIIERDAYNLKSYFMTEIFEGVIKPAAKKTFMDISRSILDGVHDTIDDGLSTIVNGKPTRGERERYTRTSYDDYYERKRGGRKRESNRDIVVSRSRSGFDYDNIIFPTKEGAKSALDDLVDMFEETGYVTVMDLYSAAKVKSDNYMYNKYGWINLSDVRIVPVENGYSIKLPRPSYLD